MPCKLHLFYTCITTLECTFYPSISASPFPPSGAMRTRAKWEAVKAQSGPSAPHLQSPSGRQEAACPCAYLPLPSDLGRMGGGGGGRLLSSWSFCLGRGKNRSQAPKTAPGWAEWKEQQHTTVFIGFIEQVQGKAKAEKEAFVGFASKSREEIPLHRRVSASV